MVIFPGREKFHAWSVDEAARRDVELADAMRRTPSMYRSVNVWGYYDRRQLIMCLLRLMGEKCRILGCNSEGLHIGPTACKCLRPGGCTRCRKWRRVADYKLPNAFPFAENLLANAIAQPSMVCPKCNSALVLEARTDKQIAGTCFGCGAKWDIHRE